MNGWITSRYCDGNFVNGEVFGFCIIYVRSKSLYKIGIRINNKTHSWNIYCEVLPHYNKYKKEYKNIIITWCDGEWLV